MQLTEMRIFDPNQPFGNPRAYRYTGGGGPSDFENNLAAIKPIFLSHKNEDTKAVEELAKQMHASRAPTYMDTKDPSIEKDNVDLVHHIRRVIQHCPGLLAYVTEVAQQSWWIPLEIAFALEPSNTQHLAVAGAGVAPRTVHHSWAVWNTRQIATYKTPSSGDLPSYLWEWPIVTNDYEAVLWGWHCRYTAPQDHLAMWRDSLRYRMKSLSAEFYI